MSALRNALNRIQHVVGNGKAHSPKKRGENTLNATLLAFERNARLAANAATLAKHCNISATAMTQRLIKYTRSGLVTRVKSGHYKLSDKGDTLLTQLMVANRSTAIVPAPSPRRRSQPSVTSRLLAMAQDSEVSKSMKLELLDIVRDLISNSNESSDISADPVGLPIEGLP